MILAGIIIRDRRIDEFNNTIAAYRKQTNMHSELKWSKVSNQKLSEYKTFVDYFFALCDTDKIHFRSIIFDNHEVDHKKFSSGNKEEGFYKFYYQLFLLFGKKYFNPKTKDTKFIIHPDYRHTKYKLNDLKGILNSGFSKKTQINESPFVSIEPKNSKNSEVIQILDIILGAIGYDKNGYLVLSGSNKAKIDLCQYITKKAGLRNLSDSTKKGQERFTIWNFRLTRR